MRQNRLEACRGQDVNWTKHGKRELPRAHDDVSADRAASGQEESLPVNFDSTRD